RAAGTQGCGCGVSEGGAGEGGIWRRLARAKVLEWSRDPRPRLRADRYPHRVAGRRRRGGEPLYRGGRARRGDHVAVGAERQAAPKFAYKLAWMKRLARHAEKLYGAGIPVVLAGDYNVVPTDHDIYPMQSYAKDALLQPQSRALFQRLLDQGWIDAIRTLHPD